MNGCRKFGINFDFIRYFFNYSYRCLRSFYGELGIREKVSIFLLVFIVG